MKKLFKNMSKPFLLGTALAMGIGTVVYANSLTVSSGDTLTASLWNSLISRVSDIESRVTALENNQGGGGDPDPGGGGDPGDYGTCGDNITVGSFTYTTKSMPDGKCWTSTNIKHTPSAGNSRCYDNDSWNCAEFGRLYDWDAAMTVCEQLGDGWSLPSDAQWQDLETSLGCTTANEEGHRCGGLGWLNHKLGGLVTSLPGIRYSHGQKFRHMGGTARIWSKTEGAPGPGYDTAWSRRLRAGGDGRAQAVGRKRSGKSEGYSVICVR